MSETLAIIGLGYVGLPLAVAFSNKFNVIGFDTNKNRINALQNGVDSNGELEKEDLKNLETISFTSDAGKLEEIDIFIVTVPTPIDEQKVPDLGPLKEASELVAKRLNKGSLVIYESTVYPGCTEEFCVPILSDLSGLVFNEEFFCGYSPERINPGDKINTLRKIIKVTSGSNKATAKRVDDLYSSVIDAGTHLAPSIKIAEASKVIENTQRDMNIAIMNEFSMIFDLQIQYLIIIMLFFVTCLTLKD